MEPMTLGSPTNSPGGSPNISYLPPFLMGEINTPTTPRTTSLSPTKGRNLAYGSPTNTIQSPPSDQRSFRQTGFGNPNSSFSQQQNQSIFNSMPTSPNMSFSNKPNGPPTQGLFDTLRSKNDQPMNKSYLGHQDSMNANGSLHNSYLNQSGYINGSQHFNQSVTSPTWQDRCSSEEENWVTVFGFPPNAATTIMGHLSHCGTILDRQYPTEGNWVNVCFSTRAERERALALNGRQLAPGIMVGVLRNKDPPQTGGNRSLNYGESFRVQPKAARSLCPTAVPEVAAPQRDTGVVSKALEYVFGW